jgi:TolB-like protein
LTHTFNVYYAYKTKKGNILMRILAIFGLLLCCISFIYAQISMILDEAILNAADFFSSKLEQGTVVAITNFEAQNGDISDYIIQELLVALANSGIVRVVERRHLEMLQSEIDFNMSGFINDDTAQGIGHMIGAQVLISGSFREHRDMYRINVQAIVVESAEIIGNRTLNVRADLTLRTLLGVAWKYNWTYIGGNIGYSALLDGRSYGFFPVGFSVYTLLQPFNHFGIAIEFTGSFAEVAGITLVPTLVFRPSSFEINLFAGVGIDLAGWAIIVPFGVRAGYKIDAGIIYTEIGPTVFDYFNHPDSTPYTNVRLHWGLGYRVGVAPRKK